MNAKSIIATAAAAVIAAALDKKNATAKSGEVGKSAVQAVREFAIVTAEHNVAPQGAADYLNAAWKATGKPAGTIKPYLSSFKGFRQAMAEGVNIENVAPEGEDAKPMTAPAARVFLLSKSERAEKAALDTIRAEIGKRARGCSNLADLTAIRDMLPEVKDSAKTVTEPSADSLLDSLVEDEAEDVGEPEGAREAVAA
jgi:hypothetical protein